MAYRPLAQHPTPLPQQVKAHAFTHGVDKAGRPLSASRLRRSDQDNLDVDPGAVNSGCAFKARTTALSRRGMARTVNVWAEPRAGAPLPERLHAPIQGDRRWTGQDQGAGLVPRWTRITAMSKHAGGT